MSAVMALYVALGHAVKSRFCKHDHVNMHTMLWIRKISFLYPQRNECLRTSDVSTASDASEHAAMYSVCTVLCIVSSDE